MAARYHVPLRSREPHTRRAVPQTDDRRWLAAIREAQETRADLAVSVAIDGIALVDSRTVEDAAHEVRVVDRRAVRCSCWAFKRKRPCAHRAYVAIKLWEEDLGGDLSEVGAIALLNTLLNAYLEPPHERRRFGPGQTGPDGLPESPYTGPTPVVA